MTEQEKRDKRVNEMVLDGAECSHIAEWWNCERCKYSPCGARRTCENLVDKGYRKEEEVQKETAKRFLKMLYDMGVDRQTVETCGIYDVNGSALARFVSQEFGVEVDE